MRKVVTGALVAIAVMVTSALVTEFVMATGRSSVLKLAKENGHCREEVCSDAEEVAVYQILTETFGYSPYRIDWCMGITDMAETRVYRGGFIKSILVWLGSLPCDEMNKEVP